MPPVHAKENTSACVNEPLSESDRGSYKLIGTYNENTSIDVSTFHPTSISQFLLVVNSITYSGGLSSGKWDVSLIGYGVNYKATFSPSMSLSGNILTLSNIAQSGTGEAGSAQYGDCTTKGYCTLTVSVYYVG